MAMPNPTIQRGRSRSRSTTPPPRNILEAPELPTLVAGNRQQTRSSKSKSKEPDKQDNILNVLSQSVRAFMASQNARLEHRREEAEERRHQQERLEAERQRQHEQWMALMLSNQQAGGLPPTPLLFSNGGALQSPRVPTRILAPPVPVTNPRRLPPPARWRTGVMEALRGRVTEALSTPTTEATSETETDSQTQVPTQTQDSGVAATLARVASDSDLGPRFDTWDEDQNRNKLKKNQADKKKHLA